MANELIVTTTSDDIYTTTACPLDEVTGGARMSVALLEKRINCIPDEGMKIAFLQL